MIMLNIPYGTQSIPHFFMVLTNAHPSFEKPLELRPVPIQKTDLDVWGLAQKIH